MFLPFVATAGWMLTEIGRQPWIVQGLLKTADANSPAVSSAMIVFSLAVFVCLYVVLLVLDIWLMRRYAKVDPPELDRDETGKPSLRSDTEIDLQELWFCLVAFFFGGYFVLEGFDLGVGLLLPFLPRNEEERSTMFRAIGPVWDGNEVWLVVAGASMFAAFPAWYATMFSGFYMALLLLLALLIVRVLSFEWRERHERSRWLGIWAWANTIGSLGAALIWGVAFSNLLYGVPIDSSGDFDGSFWDLFNLYTLLGGVAVVLLFAFHGATYLTLRTTGELCRRAAAAAGRLSIAAAVVGAGYLIWTVGSRSTATTRTSSRPCCPHCSRSSHCSAPACVWLARSGWAFVLTRPAPSWSWRRFSRASSRASWSPATTSPTASPSTTPPRRTTRSR